MSEEAPSIENQVNAVPPGLYRTGQRRTRHSQVLEGGPGEAQPEDAHVQMLETLPVTRVVAREMRERMHRQAAAFVSFSGLLLHNMSIADAQRARLRRLPACCCCCMMT